MIPVPPQLEAVISRLAMVVSITARVIRPAAIAGILASVVIGLALAPWMFHSTGAKVCWAIVVGISLAAALRLEWHRRLLRRTLGSSEFIVGWFTSLQEVGTNEARHLAEQLDGVVHADQGTRVRSALRMLTRVRNLRAFAEIGGAANAVIEPISPGRLALTGYAAIVVGVAVILSFPVLFCSLVGLALR